ncbi:hypothetical protein Dimus_020771, partial [Dionaea muscipula]
ASTVGLNHGRASTSPSMRDAKQRPFLLLPPATVVQEIRRPSPSLPSSSPRWLPPIIELRQRRAQATVELNVVPSSGGAELRPRPSSGHHQAHGSVELRHRRAQGNAELRLLPGRGPLIGTEPIVKSVATNQR